MNHCSRKLNARTGRFLREKMISDHGLFSSYEGQQGATNRQDSWGVFQECAGLWTAGWWLGGQIDRQRARAVMNHCSRKLKSRTGRFLREKMISDHGLFSSYEGQQGATNRRNSWGVFQECAGLWTAGWWLARRFHQLKASTTIAAVFQFSLFLYDVWP